MVDRILSMIRQLTREGKTVLLIEHNIGAVARVSDEVILLDDGRIVAQGSLKDLRVKTPGAGEIIQVELSEVDDPLLTQIHRIHGIKFMWRRGRYLHIFCDPPDPLFIGNMISEHGGHIESIKAETASMEDLFRFYTGKSPDE